MKSDHWDPYAKSKLILQPFMYIFIFVITSLMEIE